MLIFDQFQTQGDAEKFADHAKSLGRQAFVCASQEESNKHDPFPFKLTPPIVMVERRENDVAAEKLLEEKVDEFNGAFAGT